MAKILKELQEEQAKESKPPPAVQPSGSGTHVYEMEYNLSRSQRAGFLFSQI